MKKCVLACLAFFVSASAAESHAIMRRDVQRHTVVSRSAVGVPVLRRNLLRSNCVGCASQVTQQFFYSESCASGSCK